MGHDIKCTVVARNIKKLFVIVTYSYDMVAKKSGNLKRNYV